MTAEPSFFINAMYFRGNGPLFPPKSFNDDFWGPWPSREVADRVAADEAAIEPTIRIGVWRIYPKAHA